MADRDDLMVDGKPLSSLRVVDLKQELEKRGLSKSGAKKDLADRLKTHLELELLQQQQQEVQKVQEESPHVPNLSLTRELDDKNDFVKSYLAQQQKAYQEQIEIQHQVMSQSAAVEQQPASEPTLTAAPPEQTEVAETHPTEDTKSAEPDAVGKDTIAPDETVQSTECPPPAQETLEQETPQLPHAENLIPEKPVEADVDVSPAGVDDVTSKSAESEKVQEESPRDEEKASKEQQAADSIDSSSQNQENKGEEETSKNDLSITSTSKADDSLNESSTSKTRPKRKWGSSRAERPQRQGISTSELNNILPSKEKVSRIASQEEASVGEVGSEESASIAGSVVEASSETTAANTTFSGKFSGSAADDGNDSSVVVTTTDSVTVSDSDKASESANASKLSKGHHSPSEKVVEDMAEKVQTPPRNAVSCYLFICNLTRPFTLKALQTLLSKFGSISEDNFWIDKIKSKCIVEYDSEEHSQEARRELHGLRWPNSNPKTLSVDFSSPDELSQYKLSEQENIASAAPTKAASQQATERSDSKARPVDKYDVVLRPTNEDATENESGKRQLREWDRDKVVDEVSPKRSRQSPHERDKAVIEEQKVEKGAPGRLLDDLFRKTRALPVLYWLPLTEEEAEKRIKVREEREKKRRLEYEAREERLREMRERRNQSPRGRKNRSPPFRGQGNRDMSDRRRSPRRTSRSRSRSRSPIRRSQASRRRSRSPGRRWSPRRK